MELLWFQKPVVSGYNYFQGFYMDSELYEDELSKINTLEQLIVYSKELTRQMEKSFKETNRKLDKTEKFIRKNSREMGLLSNRFGDLIEHIVTPNIYKKFQALGFTVEKSSRNIMIQRTNAPKISTEIDILLENGDTAIVVEVKSKIREKHLAEFINKMEKFREYSDRKNDKRVFHGAIAAAILTNDQRREILENGIYVIEQSGDTVNITAPEGFVPKVW